MVKERLMQFIKRENLSISSFEKSIGVSNGYLRQLRHCPSKHVLDKIKEVYPMLDFNWLMTGNNTESKEVTDDYNELLSIIEAQKNEIAFLKKIIAKLTDDDI